MKRTISRLKKKNLEGIKLAIIKANEIHYKELKFLQ